MKKKIIIVSIIAFAVGMLTYHCLLATGSTARNPVINYEGKTNFGNVGVTGWDISGVPSFIEFTYPNLDGDIYQAYLWVDPEGTLRIASSVTMATYSSFPDVTSWTAGGDADEMGTVVGGQT